MIKALKGGMVILLTALVAALATSVSAHPGSGIVVDRRGEVYFLDTGSGVWKIDLHGKLTHLPGPGFHWMTIDSDDCFSTAHLPTGARRHHAGRNNSDAAGRQRLSSCDWFKRQLV